MRNETSTVSLQPPGVLSPDMFRFRLISSSGEDIGPFVSSDSTWTRGARLERAPGETLVVTAVVPAEDGAAFTAYIVVEGALGESSTSTR
jgi:hypothetical protein